MPLDREFPRYAEVYSNAKDTLGHALGLSDDLLHVHAGLAIFVLAALLARRRMRSWLPLGVVAVFAVANELVDAVGPDAWDSLSAADVINTLFWPSVLFLLARRGRLGAGKG
ncbi:hypothetical protein [Tsuneonella sp. SYSU-LHT278]|uniref:hypothetical protein n=1 Tax=Tsuneonella sediminis TaxID=3416089 RepID=UPI003F7910BF